MRPTVSLYNRILGIQNLRLGLVQKGKFTVFDIC